MYSACFRSCNQILDAWKANKEKVFSRAGKIQLRLQLQFVARDEKYAVLTFQQDYRPNRLADSGCKRLFVVREKLGWKIVAENGSAPFSAKQVKY